MEYKWYTLLSSPWKQTRNVATVCLIVTCMTFQTLQNVMLTESLSYMSGNEIQRFKGDEFKRVFQIAGRNITCGESKRLPKNGMYPAKLWSCYDIRVSGLRLQYWHMDGLCSDGRNASQMIANDYGALCRSMMELHGIKSNLWSAMISEATCKHSMYPRVIYIKDKNSMFTWSDYNPGRGYVITLRCMAELPKSHRPWR